MTDQVTDDVIGAENAESVDKEAATETKTYTQAELDEIVHGLKVKNNELLGETKKEREERVALAAKLEADEIARMEEQNQHKELATKYKQELEDLKRANQEERARANSEKLAAVSTELGAKYSNEPRNAKLLARFIRDGLTVVDGEVVGKEGETIDELIKAMDESGDYDSLWKGSQSDGGGAIGNKGGRAAKSFTEFTAAELKDLRSTDPHEYQRIRDAYYNTN